jgi:hypothetical protein
VSVVKFLCCVGLCLAAGAISADAQDSTGQKTSEQKKPNTFFSGTVAECAADHLSVSRRISGKLEKRTFRITADTKVEGKLQTKVRVTVQYTADDQGYSATQIVVHTTVPKKQ